MWRKGNPCALLVGMQIGTAIVESSMELPQKLKMELPYDPLIPLLEIDLKKSETNLKVHMYPYIHCSIIYNSQDLEGAQVPISR